MKSMYLLLALCLCCTVFARAFLVDTNGDGRQFVRGHRHIPNNNTPGDLFSGGGNDTAASEPRANETIPGPPTGNTTDRGERKRSIFWPFYHGNHCGLGRGTPDQPALNRVDEMCKRHDACLAEHDSWLGAAYCHAKAVAEYPPALVCALLGC